MKICESCGEPMNSNYDEFVCDGCLYLDEPENVQSDEELEELERINLAFWDDMKYKERNK